VTNKRLYERFIKRTTVRTLDKKNEKEDLSHHHHAGGASSVKYPYVGDAR